MRRKIGFGAVGITGGKPGNLDYINSGATRNNDLAIVVDNYRIFFYIMKEYSGAEPNPPYIVKPADITPDAPKLAKLRR